jgi:effector-binding domain-containing protein
MDNIQQILTRIVIRNDSSINWESSNPVLLKGEMGVDTDLNKIKIGDGFKTWKELSYSSDSGYDDTQIKSEIKSNADAISVLIGTKEGDNTKTVREIAADEINALIGGANNEDTITNIATLIRYVNENGAELTGIQTDIANIQAIVSGFGGEGQPTNVIDFVEKEIAAIATANLTIDKDNIAIITKGLIIPELNKFEVSEGKVTKVSTDLLSQGENTLVLNGGSATI